MNNQCDKLILILIGMLVYENAFAYLDPGTGSLIIQGFIAAVVGGLVVIKVYWHKFKSLFSSRKTKAKLATSEPVSEDATSDFPKD